MSILEAWAALSIPSDQREYTATHVARSNAWVYKDFRGGFGLLLTGVDPPTRVLPLKNILIGYRASKEVDEQGQKRLIPRCLEVTLDPGCNPEAMATVMQRLEVLRPGGTYSTDDLLKVIQDASELFKLLPPPVSKDSVVGVWGELHLLELLETLCEDATAQSQILRAWEAEGPRRDLLDFRFLSPRIVIEVKSTLGKRIHHFQGFGQVTVPSGYARGLVASIVLRDAPQRTGRTAHDLVEAIKRGFKGSGLDRTRFEEVLSSKLTRRGREAYDDRFSFHPEDQSLVLYQMADVPRPSAGDAIVEIEWSSDFSGVVPLSQADADAILATVVHLGGADGTLNV